MHELQHFRDCLFTPSGAYIFLQEATRMHSIVARLADMRKGGHIVTKPFSHLKDFLDDGNQIGFEVGSQLFDFFFQRSLFNGDLPSLPFPYDHEFDENIGIIISADLGYGQHRVPFFPKRILVDGEMSIVAEPIGFRALTEARATHMQTEIISIADPTLVTHVNSRWKYLPEYATANMMFTKSVKLTGAVNSYRTPSDFSVDYWRWLFHSLHGGGDPAIKTSIGYPGQIALQLATDNVGDQGFMHETYSKDEARINLRLQDMIQETISHFGSDQHFVPTILRFAASHWLIPALRRYHDHVDAPVSRDFPLEAHYHFLDEADRLLKKQEPLPNPMAYFYDGKLHYNDEYGLRDSDFRLSWYFWVATRQNLSEAWDSTELTCPLARGRYKTLLGEAIGTLSDHCESGINNKTCGSLSLGASNQDHPKCPWKRHLEHIGLIVH